MSQTEEKTFFLFNQGLVLVKTNQEKYIGRFTFVCVFVERGGGETEEREREKEREREQNRESQYPYRGFSN